MKTKYSLTCAQVINISFSPQREIFRSKLNGTQKKEKKKKLKNFTHDHLLLILDTKHSKVTRLNLQELELCQ